MTGRDESSGLAGEINAMLEALEQTQTQRKRAEEELKKYAEQLEETNRLKDLFTDIMRHDLLNPIGIVKNYSELLMDVDSEEKRLEMLKGIKKNTLKALEMIESASKLAKIESKDQLKLEKLDINKILQSVVRQFKPLLKERQITLEYNVKGRYLARANPVIEEVFANLISNAIKYSPDKSRIGIGIDDEGDDWKIWVKDQGGGIPDDAKEEIFERFKRKEKGAVKGSGLGLAIVKRIVDLHKGRVWIEDNPEGGSIFCVKIPKELGTAAQ